MIAPGAAARPRGQDDATRTDPRKAAVRLPEYDAFEALEVPENARCAGREPPLFSLSGGWRAPSWTTPTMPAPGVGMPASASACLQPAEGGEGSVFRGPARAPLGASTPATGTSTVTELERVDPETGRTVVEYRHDGNVVGVEDPEAGVSRMY